MQKKDNQKMTRITITVPEDLLEQFKKYCDRQYRPVSTQIQFMMSEAIEGGKGGEGK
jgi:metal-responsive CopG/Arc/MetJ family transcriptional regulator